MKTLASRIRLLSRGIRPPLINSKPMMGLDSQGTGVGPQGKIFELPEERNGMRSMISVPVYYPDHHLFPYSLPTRLGDQPNTLIVNDEIVLQGASYALLSIMKLSSGALFTDTGLVMMHCYDTLTTVLGYGCRHFENGEECRYCEIDPVAVKMLGFPQKQSIPDLVEAILIVQDKIPVRSLTITSGTFSTPDDVARQYLRLLPELKEKTGLGIHLQLEPVNDVTLLKELSLYADSIGVFMEIFDDDLRRKFCPGKSGNSRALYMKNWETAVRHFRHGQVINTCILGFGENYRQVLEEIEQCAGTGVKTIMLFLRCYSRHLNGFIPSYLNKSESETVDLHLKAAEILKKYDLVFQTRRDAGCVGCQGCTAFTEAFRAIN